jgi:hypothetical protein
MNAVYYDKVIWEAKYKWNETTKELTEEKNEKLYPIASVTKVITVSSHRIITFTSMY